jgi:AraC family transcriptional activator FtrA
MVDDNPHRFTHAPRVVAAVVSQGLLTFDFAIACEVFGLDRSDVAGEWYEFRVVTNDTPPLRTSTGFTVDDVSSLAAAEDAQTLIVPGWADPDREPDDATISLLRRRYQDGARIVSFCTGTFVLAAAGLLDDRRATTHWMYAERLSARYPKIKLDPSVLYIEDGAIFTAAGTAAGMDLALHLVAQDFGQRVANSVARRIVLPPLRTGGQAQYIEYDLPTRNSAIGELIEWIESNLSEDITLESLADKGHMSVRSLSRRFHEELGMSPMAWLRNRRIVRAREMLEATSLPVDAIASRCGFRSPAALRSHFRKLFMTTPSAYRETFQAS